MLSLQIDLTGPGTIHGSGTEARLHTVHCPLHEKQKQQCHCRWPRYKLVAAWPKGEISKKATRRPPARSRKAGFRREHGGTAQRGDGTFGGLGLGWLMPVSFLDLHLAPKPPQGAVPLCAVSLDSRPRCSPNYEREVLTPARRQARPLIACGSLPLPRQFHLPRAWPTSRGVGTAVKSAPAKRVHSPTGT